MKLKRFWIEFENAPKFSPLGIGMGITCENIRIALAMADTAIKNRGLVLNVRSIAEDIDVRTLDQTHVVPNMGVVSNRGVWFPMGY